MQEAWCRSWRQCVQTLPFHTHTPFPHQVVPLEHFCVGRNSCWTVALTHPQIVACPWGPDPAVQQCCFLLLATGAAVPVAGQDLVPKSKDYCRHLTWWFSWFLISWKKCSYCWCVCVYVCSVLWKFFIQTSLTYFNKDQIDLLELGNISLLSFSKGILLDYFLSIIYAEEMWWQESEGSTFSSRGLPSTRRLLQPSDSEGTLDSWVWELPWKTLSRNFAHPASVSWYVPSVPAG